MKKHVETYWRIKLSDDPSWPDCTSYRAFATSYWTRSDAIQRLHELNNPNAKLVRVKVWVNE